MLEVDGTMEQAFHYTFDHFLFTLGE